MKSIRDKNSMCKVYQCKCYPTDQGLLMQIPRCYTGFEIFGGHKAQCSTSSFRSLLRPGKFNWQLDSTYYCYAGTHKYRTVPTLLSAKLNLIAVCGDIKTWTYNLKSKISLKFMRVKWAISAKIKYYRNYKENKEAKRFYKSLLK